MTPHRCFLALLLVAAIIWKLKQRYDMYRRRQRLFLEMEQMASRAFSRVLVEIERRDIENSESDNDLTDCSKNKKVRIRISFLKKLSILRSLSLLGSTYEAYFFYS